MSIKISVARSFHTSIAEAPTYLAISYVWGDETNRDMIRIASESNKASESISVTRSCASILSRLAQIRKSVVLWIDGICINQKDTNERDRQVSIMGEIYKNATQVIVDLGEEFEDSGVAIATLKAVVDLVNTGASIGGVPFSRIEARAIERLITRPWFTRVWVLLEVSVAKEEPLVMCGLRDSIGFETLRFALWWLRPRVKWLPELPVVYRITNNVGEYKPRTGGHVLLDLLRTTQNCQATNPRDKLFALLPLFSDAREQGLSVQYHKSEAEVYLQLAESLLKSNGLIVLACVQGSSIYLDLPSWAPDWSVKPTNQELLRTYSDVHSGTFEIIHNGVKPPLLRASGFCAGIITVLSSVLETHAGVTFDAVQKLFEEIYASADSLPRFVTCESDEDNRAVYFKTFVPPELVVSGKTDEPKVGFKKLRIGPSLLHGDAGHFEIMLDQVIPNFTDSVGDRRRLVMKTVLGRRFGFVNVGKAKFPALMPRDSALRDMLCFLEGCSSPLVLRESDECWKVVGNAYVANCRNIPTLPKEESMTNLEQHLRRERKEMRWTRPERQEFLII